MVWLISAPGWSLPGRARDSLISPTPVSSINRMPCLLAQQSVLPIWGWSFLLIALVIGLFVVVWWTRRRAAGADGAGGGASPAQPFSLSDLRTMRESGQITDEQYEKLRAAAIGAARGRAGGAG